jgi:hypothetical protein
MKRIPAITSATALAAAMLLVSPMGASADTQIEVASAISRPAITNSDWNDALTELDEAGLITSSTPNADGSTTSVVELGEGMTFEATSAPRESRLSGGSDSRGLYVKFNQVDQDALIAVAGFALGAAICAIPAVGQVACVVVGAIITAATIAASALGKCKNNKQLKVYVNSRAASCV